MRKFPLPAAVLAASAIVVVAPGARADDAQPSTVENCPKKLGVLRVAEPQQGWGWLGQYGLGSPSALLRTLVMQSNCFDVVERGAGMQDCSRSAPSRRAANCDRSRTSARARCRRPIS